MLSLYASFNLTAVWNKQSRHWKDLAYYSSIRQAHKRKQSHQFWDTDTEMISKKIWLNSELVGNSGKGNKRYSYIQPSSIQRGPSSHQSSGGSCWPKEKVLVGFPQQVPLFQAVMRAITAERGPSNSGRDGPFLPIPPRYSQATWSGDLSINLAMCV